ncbi:MAG: flagellar export protein FliJ [Proteobacteria bacterium]|nr:flagellar export protein FliJ [Pseudomonadota bacterium]NBX45913.1 flagellar export protein FliJ [Chloroflexota bacterium]NBQ30847.1 flagellar export protein FliJ [Pseudomonadota bacterium]NBQ62608.1 flagellar export protein FliJ [Pseudomonadota bacterium]NBT02454.1 flagellar export protein FliJ [Pseudomonadota bacterium]
MARFVFRLQTVLEHRKRLEDLAKVAFGESQGGLFREQATLRGFQEDEERTVDHLEVIQHEGILDMENLQLGLRFLDVIKVQIDRQTQVVARAEARVEQRRQELVAAMQARKALDRLREKQLADFKRLEQLREMKEVDEMAVMRHGLEARQLASQSGSSMPSLTVSVGGMQ